MLDLTNLALFITASWILIVTPGPDMIYVITRGIAQGRKAAVISVFGVILGILIHTLIAAFGLAVVLQTSAVAFNIIKYVGAAYLLYLGIKMIRDKQENLVGDIKPLNTRTVFVQGFLSNLFNPKLALFFLAFLPQFVNPAMGGEMVQIISLGILFSLFGLLFLLTLAYFSGSVGQWVSSRPKAFRNIRWFSGGMLVLLGLRLAFIEKR